MLLCQMYYILRRTTSLNNNKLIQPFFIRQIILDPMKNNFLEQKQSNKTFLIHQIYTSYPTKNNLLEQQQSHKVFFMLKISSIATIKLYYTKSHFV